MIRLIFLLRRKPALSLEAFQKYWREEHGPLVASHAQRIGALKYVQVHRLDDPINDAMAKARGGMEAPYDGVAELWWDSEEALTAVLSNKAGSDAGAELLEDERRFIDLANSPLWFAHEYPQVNPTPENIVARERIGDREAVLPAATSSRADRGGRAALLAYQPWPADPIAGECRRHSAIPAGAPVRQRVGDSTARIARDADAPYTGHAEVWFDRGIARQGPEAAASNARAIEDESKFIDFKRSGMWIGKEHVFIDRM